MYEWVLLFNETGDSYSSVYPLLISKPTYLGSKWKDSCQNPYWCSQISKVSAYSYKRRVIIWETTRRHVSNNWEYIYDLSNAMPDFPNYSLYSWKHASPNTHHLTVEIFIDIFCMSFSICDIWGRHRLDRVLHRQQLPNRTRLETFVILKAMVIRLGIPQNVIVRRLFDIFPHPIFPKFALGQHWIWLWLGAVQMLPAIWTNVDWISLTHYTVILSFPWRLRACLNGTWKFYLFQASFLQNLVICL